MNKEQRFARKAQRYTRIKKIETEFEEMLTQMIEDKGFSIEEGCGEELSTSLISDEAFLLLTKTEATSTNTISFGTQADIFVMLLSFCLDSQHCKEYLSTMMAVVSEAMGRADMDATELLRLIGDSQTKRSRFISAMRSEMQKRNKL